jgi:hypothetical protein
MPASLARSAAFSSSVRRTVEQLRRRFELLTDRLVFAGTRQLPPLVIYDDQLARATWRASPHLSHREGGDRLGDRRVLAERFPRLHDAKPRHSMSII